MICGVCKLEQTKINRKDNYHNETWVCKNKKCAMFIDVRLIDTWTSGQRGYTTEEIRAVKKLRHQGYTLRQIVNLTGIPKSTIGDWVL